MSFCVYAHINKTDGKRYIGITSQRPAARWHKGSNYVGNEYFSRAIQKYGWDNFDHIILADGLDKETAEALERQYIREYDTCDRSKGYNILPGGDVSESLTKEAKEKMSQSAKRRFSNPDERSAQSERLKSYFSTEAARKKNGISQKKRFLNPTEREHQRDMKRERFQGIEQYSKTGDLIKSFECLMDAQREGFARNAIKSAARSGNLSYGYYWRLT